MDGAPAFLDYLTSLVTAAVFRARKLSPPLSRRMRVSSFSAWVLFNFCNSDEYLPNE